MKTNKKKYDEKIQDPKTRKQSLDINTCTTVSSRFRQTKFGEYISNLGSQVAYILWNINDHQIRLSLFFVSLFKKTV